MRCIRFASLCSMLVIAACGGDSATPALPVSPSPAVIQTPPQPRGAPLSNWRGEATVMSRSGSGGCGWGTNVGDVRGSVFWRVTITGESVLLEEDMDNWPTDHIPYDGTLLGQQFSATYSQGPDYLRWACQFKGGELSGSFSPDFSSFEAVETLVWGAPGAETVVRRRWIASRL